MGDAIYTQEEICKMINEKEGESFFISPFPEPFKNHYFELSFPFCCAPFDGGIRIK